MTIHCYLKKEYITFSENFSHILYDNAYLINDLFPFPFGGKRPKRNIFLKKLISLLLFSEIKAGQCLSVQY